MDLTGNRKNIRNSILILFKPGFFQTSLQVLKLLIKL